MSDQDLFRNFDPGSIAVNTPLSAGEVRRRGDRMRRRRHAVVGTAAAAVVAVMTGGIALGVGGADDQRSLDPAETPTASVSPTDTRPPEPTPSTAAAIPDGFPLTDGWPRADVVQSMDELGMTEPGRDQLWALTYGFTPCTYQVPRPDVEDRLVSWLNVGVQGRVRELMVFGSADEAQAWVRETADLARGCTVAKDGEGGERGYLVRDVDPVGPAAGTSIWWTAEEGGEAGPGQEVVQLVTRGEAVLVNWAWDRREQAHWTPPFEDDFEGFDQRYREESAGVVEAMCLVTAEGCPAEVPMQSESPDLTLPDAPGSERVGQGDVPDLDLLRGLLDVGSDGGLDGPAADLEGVDRMLVCGEPVVDQSLEVTGRLVGRMHGPETGEYHQVIAYRDADEALAQMAHLRALFVGCERQRDQVAEQAGMPPMEIRWRHQETDTGYDTVSFGYGWVLRGTDRAGMPGGETVQVTRVGRALLVAGNSGEGTIGDFGRYVDDLTVRTRDLAPDLCTFTQAGCRP